MHDVSSRRTDRVATCGRLQALLVHVKIAQEERHFKVVLRALLERFQGESGQALLQKRGTLIIRGLCSMLGGTRVFRELATILEAEPNYAFAASITQALNLMLLSAPELSHLRAQLQRSQRDPGSAHLLRTLYSCWCHSACAALSLCMLAEAYQHVGAMIHTLADLPLVPVLLAQVDRCAPCHHISLPVTRSVASPPSVVLRGGRRCQGCLLVTVAAVV